MEGLVFIVLLVLAYPFIAAWMVGAGRGRRLDELERELTRLRETVDELTRRARADAAARAAADVRTAADVRAAAPVPVAVAPPVRMTPPMPATEPASESAPEPVNEPAAEPAAYKPLGARHPAAAARASWQPKPGAARGRAASPASAAPSPAPAAPSPASAAPSPAPAAPSPAPAVPAAAGGDSMQAATPQANAGATRLPPPPPPPRWLLAARDWLFTGNLVAKLGLVILFIGIGFLLKYVAATVVVPIELRLAGVVLADLALLGWGWRLRTARREIGLPVQGAAIAILMLVVFGAYQRYGLLPAGFTFALLVALTAFTCLLALLQDAFWLAAFGIAGGFAAPLLVATGQGNHVALFSYYALLNAGVFALAVRRSWRPLNLIGFGFTFVVGALWGGLRYTPDHYLSAQAFLILFFLFYVGIALAYARRQQTRLKDYVDATLVLGTPLLAFGLQVGLVRGKPFGLALSALALGGFYLGLGMLLWMRGGGRWRVLIETFASAGVIFGTLAIPLALDGRWTSGAWALEGAGFVWFGLRRGQKRIWLFGMLLQAGAWIGFIGAAAGLDLEAATGAHLWLGFVLLAGAAFAIAISLRRHAGNGAPVIGSLAGWCLAIAATWLLAGWWTEAILRTGGSALADWLAGGALLTALLLGAVAARLAWRLAGILALGAQVLAAIGLIAVSAAGWAWFDMLERDGAKPLLGVRMIALAAFATARMLARAAPALFDRQLAPTCLAWGAAWWFGPVLNIGAGRLAPWLPDSLGGVHAGWILLYALGVAASAAAGMVLARRLAWPALRWLGAASWGMLALLTVDNLLTLYEGLRMPAPAAWLAWALLLAGAEYVMHEWMRDPAPHRPALVKSLHLLRSGGPWLAIWPAGAILVDGWLGGADPAASGWATSPAWANYLPAWAMMGALVMLLRRSRANAWPTQPVAAWYRSVLIPCGAALVLALAALWNLVQDGGMAPLPYLPLLNPLDLTTGFALVLGMTVIDAALGYPARPPETGAGLRLRLRIAGLVLAYGWFNLILLRSAAHYLGIAYRIDALAASQFVQAMLSLVWSASALVIMRYAARRTLRRTWASGAVLLAVVVCKLFVVDLAGGGSMARIVSFVGAGLLMLLIGYIAPYPKAAGAANAITPSAGT